MVTSRLVEAFLACPVKCHLLSKGERSAGTEYSAWAAAREESYVRQHGQIKRAEVMDLCRLTEGQAKELLRRLAASRKIELRGAGRASMYVECAGPAQA